MEDGTYSVFDIEEEVVNEGLYEIVSVRDGKGAEADREEPYVDICYREP